MKLKSRKDFLDESLNNLFGYKPEKLKIVGKLTKVQQELIKLIEDSLPVDFLDSVLAIEPDDSLIQGVHPLKKDKIIDYTGVSVYTSENEGDSKIEYQFGIKKRTSGPDTGYIYINKKSNGYVSSDAINGFASEFYIDAGEKLLKLYNKIKDVKIFESLDNLFDYVELPWKDLDMKNSKSESEKEFYQDIIDNLESDNIEMCNENMVRGKNKEESYFDDLTMKCFLEENLIKRVSPEHINPVTVVSKVNGVIYFLVDGFDRTLYRKKN